jgi:3'(2'), 5'-bisphosphate nucleotidase
MTPAPVGDPATDLASGALEAAIADIAEAAATLILPYWRSGLVAARKADDSPVTEADQKAEALILGQLAALWPDVPAVAEEASAAGAVQRTGPWWWLVDPLDGTRGFVAGKDAFTVNIALMREVYPAAGVVVAPALGRTWASAHGGAGRGARQRAGGGPWSPLRARSRSAEAEMLLSHSVGEAAAAAMAETWGAARWRGVDSSLKFCLIAAGEADLYPRTGPTSEWDTAAGQAVLEAAGGSVTDHEKARLRYGKPGFLNGAFVARGA